jgi:hypothetical protein
MANGLAKYHDISPCSTAVDPERRYPNRSDQDAQNINRINRHSPMRTHAGGIVVHVAASQLTSSKLCMTSNPIDEKPSKLPSPSILMC